MSTGSAYLGPLEIKAAGENNSGPQVILPGDITGQAVVFATTEDGPYTITVTGAAPFLGLVAGDTITIANASNAGNNGTKTIVSVDNTAGSIVTVEEPLVNETSASPSPVVITQLP